MRELRWRNVNAAGTVRIMHVTRLRQVVVAAAELAPTIVALRTAFGLGEPFADPGVAEFGLVNGVLPIGDQFVEVVTPVTTGTAAGRWMDRGGGDRGYMVILQVASITSARAHLGNLGHRFVWSADLGDISANHLHPASIGGAIVSIDEPRPPASWRWGGPDWQANVRTSVVSGVAGLTMAAEDPAALLANWAAAFALQVEPGVGEEHGSLTLGDGSRLAFVGVDAAVAGGRDGLVGIDLYATDHEAVGRDTTIAGTRFRLVKSAR